MLHYLGRLALAGCLAVFLTACQSDTQEPPAPAEAPPPAEASQDAAEAPPAVAGEEEIPEPPDPGPLSAEVWNYVMTPTPTDEAIAEALIVWAEVDVDSGPAPLTVAFSCEPLETGVKSPSYEWDFGDGSPKVTAEAPSHTYTKPGTYTVRVVVTDADGHRGTDEVEVEVEEPEATGEAT